MESVRTRNQQALFQTNHIFLLTEFQGTVMGKFKIFIDVSQVLLIHFFCWTLGIIH